MFGTFLFIPVHWIRFLSPFQLPLLLLSLRSYTSYAYPVIDALFLSLFGPYNNDMKKNVSSARAFIPKMGIICSLVDSMLRMLPYSLRKLMIYFSSE